MLPVALFIRYYGLIVNFEVRHQVGIHDNVFEYVIILYVAKIKIVLLIRISASCTVNRTVGLSL